MQSCVGGVNVGLSKPDSVIGDVRGGILERPPRVRDVSRIKSNICERQPERKPNARVRDEMYNSFCGSRIRQG
jgi:hypothetical protein